MNRLRGLDLFSGIGGISLALSPWVETVAYCEREPYAQAVLLERMQSNDLDIAPIWDDVTTLSREVLDTEIDIIFGGFPCQDISVAGNGKGLEGERSGLFFEIMRLAKEFQPAFIFLENVPAITGRGLDAVAKKKIAELGYDCRWGVLSAYDVGAPHKRDRWFLLAYSRGAGLQRPGISRRTSAELLLLRDCVGCGPHPDTDSLRRLEPKGSECHERGRRRDVVPETIWSEVPDMVPGVDDGVRYRMERRKTLGNAVVPQAAREAFKRLMGIV